MIEYRNVSVSYGKKKVLNKFNLKVGKGEKVVLYGKSGGGKSTILRLLLGFAKPDSGKVLFDDKPIDEKTVWDARKKIAYVSQDFDIGEGKVKKLVEEVMSFKANSNLEFKAALLKQFLLSKSYLEKDIEDLSGGERQRVAIILSLALKRDVFLLDEITSALDKKLREKVVDYYLNAKSTIIAVSHDDTWLKPGIVRVDL